MTRLQRYPLYFLQCMCFLREGHLPFSGHKEFPLNNHLPPSPAVHKSGFKNPWQHAFCIILNENHSLICFTVINFFFFFDILFLTFFGLTVQEFSNKNIILFVRLHFQKHSICLRKQQETFTSHCLWYFRNGEHIPSTHLYSNTAHNHTYLPGLCY